MLVCAALASGCAFKPWTPHAVLAPKPTGRLEAPPGKALLLVVVSSPTGAGNGAITVFEKDGPLAQFEETSAAWSSRPLAPGIHQIYIRTWTSAFCGRVTVNLTAGKVHALNLNSGEVLGPVDCIASGDRSAAGVPTIEGVGYDAIDAK